MNFLSKLLSGSSRVPAERTSLQGERAEFEGLIGGRREMRLLVAVIAVVTIAAAACGDDDASAEDVRAALLEGVPACSDLVGQELPHDYDGCVEGDTINAIAIYHCADGRTLTSSDHGWGYLGELYSKGPLPADERNACHEDATTGPPGTKTPDTTPPTTEQAGDASAVAYFEAFAAGGRDQLQRMAELAVEGSTAHRYALFQLAGATAREDTGYRPTASEMTEQGDSIRLCDSGVTPAVCSVYSDFEMGPGGRLRSFTIDGVAVSDRVVVGDGSGTPALDGSVRLVAAYNSPASGLLVVVIEVTAVSRPLRTGLFGASYLAPDGRQVEAQDTVTGTSDLQPGGRRMEAVAFPGSALGGSLTFDIHDAETYDGGPVTISVPAAATAA